MNSSLEVADPQAAESDIAILDDADARAGVQDRVPASPGSVPAPVPASASAPASATASTPAPAPTARRGPQIFGSGVTGSFGLSAGPVGGPGAGGARGGKGSISLGGRRRNGVRWFGMFVLASFLGLLLQPQDADAARRNASKSGAARLKRALGAAKASPNPAIVHSDGSHLFTDEDFAGPSEVVRMLRRAGVQSDEFGVFIQPLGKGTLNIRHNEEAPLNPASTMKLVTTNAAMSLLGPDYRWVTALYTTGRIEEGALLGDLILKGGGDPKLVEEDLHEIVANLRASGLKEIRGNLVIDDSLFAASAERLQAFDGDELAPYNVTPYAAMMNFKALRVRYSPGHRSLATDPPLADVRLENDVQVLKGRRCRGGISMRDGGVEDVALIRITGAISSACGEQQMLGAALSHRQFIHGLFKAQWTEAGGILRGTTLVKPGAAKGEPYYEWYSPRTLTDVVYDVNKFSNNVMARMLLLQIGAQSQSRPAMLEDGRRAIAEWYHAQGLPMRSLVIENGSGLSRIARVSASDLGAALRMAAQSPYAALFEGSLPQVGVDGTMRARLRHDPVYGNAFIKTGTLNDARAIAGYVTAASGEKYVVVMLVNGVNAHSARPAQDALLSWVYQRG